MNDRFEEISIPLSPITVRAKAWGNPKSPAIIAVHGWLDNASTFDKIAPYLEKYYLIALDMPGHGLSDHYPQGTGYPFIEYICDVIRIVNQLELEEFIFLGHSMGAVIGSIVAGTFPQRVKKLILIDGISPITIEPEEAPKLLQRSILYTTKIHKKELPMYDNIEKAIAVRQKAGMISKEAATCLVERGLKQVRNQYTWRTDPRLRTPSRVRFTFEQSVAFLRQITAQTLLIVAKDGIFKGDSLVDKIKFYMKEMKIVQLEGHHHLHLEYPEPVARTIQQFLR